MIKKEVVIVDMPSPGVMGGVYSELILALIHSINSLGFKVSYERRLIQTKNPVIVFGFYRYFINNSPKIQLPSNYFIFNLAPIVDTQTHWFQNYLGCACNHNLIDYSHNNIAYFTKKITSQKLMHIFGFGYINLMPFEGLDRSENYLFFGKS